MQKYLTPQDYKVAESNGISNRRAYERFYVFGWSTERTITEPVRQKRDLSKWVKIAKERNIPKGTFYHRVGKRMNWSPQKAATTPVIGSASRAFVSTEDEFFGGS